MIAIYALWVALLSPLVGGGQVGSLAEQGSIQGQVVLGGRNEPIRGVTVSLSLANAPANPGIVVTSTGAPFPEPVETRTDEQGRFAFRGLKGDNYRLIATKNGFVRMEYGQRVLRGRGTSFRLAQGQQKDDVVFRLVPTGSITGRLSDTSGTPATEISVQLLRPVYNSAGRRTFEVVGESRTDDRGEFRIYWIVPGDYYLAAGSALAQALPNGIDPTKGKINHALTYYPGVGDVALARTVTVLSETEVRADLTLGTGRLYRIAGRVVDGRTGRVPVSPVVLSFEATSATGTGLGSRTLMGSNSFYNAQDGTFRFPNLFPGTYAVGAQSQSAFSYVEARLVDADVENLDISIGSANILGRLIVEGVDLRTIPEFDKFRIQLRSLTKGSVTSQPPNGDGSVDVRDVPWGEYRVVVAGLSPEFYIKSVRFNQIDMLNKPIRVVNEERQTLDVTLSPRAGHVGGFVRDEKLVPMPGAQIVILPLEESRNDAPLAAIADADGHFMLHGVAPGEYKILAWDPPAQYEYLAPGFRQRYEERGTAVRVVDSATLTVNVKLVLSEQDIH